VIGGSGSVDLAPVMAGLHERLGRFVDHEDYAAVLDPETFRLGCTALTAACAGETSAADAAALVRLAGWVRWFRCDALTTGPTPDKQRADGEREAALRLFTVLYWTRKDLVPPSLLETVTRLAEAGLNRTRADRDGDLGFVLADMARTVKDMDGISRSLKMFRRALEQGRDLTDRLPVLINLSLILWFRFEWSQSPADLEEAIDAIRAAEHELPGGDHRRASAVQNLGVALQTLYEHTGDPAVLEECLRVRRQALAEPADLADPDRTNRLSGLSIALRLRFERTRNQDDLDEAISVARQGVDAAAALGAPPSGALSMLAATLTSRYEATGYPDDLDEAINLDRAAVERTEPGDRDRAMYLHNLSTALGHRFHHAGQPGDLDESIDVSRAAHACTTRTDNSAYLSGLAVVLQDRYEQTGDLADLNESVQTARDAVEATASADVYRAERLSNLGIALQMRFQRTGDLADIDGAIQAGRAAVAAAGNDRERGRNLNNLSASLQIRFTRTRNAGDLNAAVAASQDAVTLLNPSGSPDRAAALSVLTLALDAQVEAAGDRPELAQDSPEKAVAAAREAVASTPATHVRRPGRLLNLGVALYTRYTRTGNLPDADEAIQSVRAALQLMPSGHPDRATCLASLGQFLQARSAASPGDGTYELGLLAEAFAAWREGSGLQAAPARTRLICAARWAFAASEAGLVAEAEEGHEVAVGLLPLMAWRGLDRVTQESHLAQWGLLTTDAAAWAITAGHPQHAVELLEQGRSILWSQLLQTRDEVDDLRTADPALALRLDSIRASLDGRDTDPPPTAEERMNAAADWDFLIEEIRTRPGFETFLAIPPFARLSAAAANGPVVVINVSDHRCDALAVTTSGVQVIPLPELTKPDADRNAAAFVQALSQSGWAARTAAALVTDSVLGWMWTAVTAPVLAALNLLPDQPPVPPLPRIWWCPTGSLTHLPLHAAATAPAGPGVIDHVVSSYIPTLQTLHRAQSSAGDHYGRPQRLLLVTMPETPGLPDGALPGTAMEGQTVARFLGSDLTSFTGPDATIGHVSEAMAGHVHAHFACHAGVNPEHPDHSGLLLQDGVLTIKALSGIRRRPAGMAFLSACQTAAGSMVNPDEAITMAMAMHVAGFRHVIATLWNSADDISPDVAGYLYGALSGPDGRLAIDGAGRALHAAARRLRARGFSPKQWAPFIHSGP
jgi:hypothetical protein